MDIIERAVSVLMHDGLIVSTRQTRCMASEPVVLSKEAIEKS